MLVSQSILHLKTLANIKIPSSVKANFNAVFGCFTEYVITIQCRLVKDLNADNADASSADFRGFLVS